MKHAVEQSNINTNKIITTHESKKIVHSAKYLFY